MNDDLLESTSFHIEQEVELKASPERAWDALCDVNAWWSHRFDLPESSLELDPRPGGLFWQKSTGSNGVVFGQVTFIEHGKKIRLTGPLGQTTPVTSVYEWELKPKGNASLLKLRHQCVGLISADAHQSYSHGWAQLWGHLRDFIEHGKRYESGA